MISRRVASGRWEEVANNVFRIAGVAPSWSQSLMVACLAWGPGSAISHLAGAVMWHVPPFETGDAELTVPRARSRAGPGIVHRNRLDPVDMTAIGPIPVTTPARTLIDVASVSSRDATEEALDDALRRGLVTLPRMRRRLTGIGGNGGRRGVALMRSLLDARQGDGVPESVLETKVLRVIKRAGLPRPALQHRIRAGNRPVAIVDFAYPKQRLAIEADGYRWHSGRARWQSDLTRRNRITALGWHVIHVTWDDVERPGDVIDSIRRALAAGSPARAR